MDFIDNMFVCLLVVLYGTMTACQQSNEDYFNYFGPLTTNRPPSIPYAIKKLLDIPNFNGLHLRLVPQIETRPIAPKVIPSFEVLWQRKTTTPHNKGLEKHNDSNRLGLDCSDLIKVDCAEQRKLVNDVFKDLPKEKNNKVITTRFRTDKTYVDTDKIEIDFDENETTTMNYEYDDLGNRIAPELVASFLG